MVPDIGRIVTRAAEPGNTGPVEHVVQSAHPGDVDRNTVEDLLAAGDGPPRGDRTAALSVKIGPGIVNIEDHRIEDCIGRVEAKRVVAANKKLGNARGQRRRTAVGAGCGQLPSSVIMYLRGKYTGALRRIGARVRRICRRAKCRRAAFKRDNLLLLVGTRSWLVSLRVSERRVNRLFEQVRLAPVPHNRAQKA